MRVRPQHRRSAQVGFTLIELMTVIVILGVLAVVAIGAYAKHVRNAKKTEVVSDLSNLTLREKTWFATNGHYASTTDCEGGTCTYPLMAAIFTAKGPVQWVVADEEFTRATEGDGPYYRGGGAVHGFDALKFVPEGGDSWCGYAAISGYGATASVGADIPPVGELSAEVFPAANADPYIARDWFYGYALCDFDFDNTYWAFTTAHYTSEVNMNTTAVGTYVEGE